MHTMCRRARAQGGSFMRQTCMVPNHRRHVHIHHLDAMCHMCTQTPISVCLYLCMFEGIAFS